jgi:hypothetical protein
LRADDLLNVVWRRTDGLTGTGTDYLSETARRLADVGWDADSDRLMSYAAATPDRMAAARITGSVMALRLQAGDPHGALTLWRPLLTDQRTNELPVFTATVVQAFPAIAALDAGHALAALASQLRKAHAWWVPVPQ